MDDLRDLYQDLILDHGRHPRNHRMPEPVTHAAHGHNPLCGDRIDVHLRLDGSGRVEDAGFQGRGCAISVASASMMTDMVRGLTEEQARRLVDAFQALCTGQAETLPEGTLALTPDADEDAAEKLMVLAGVRRFPMRVKCATLAWHTLKAALDGRETISTEDEE